MKVYRGLGLKQSTVSSLCCREMNACKKKKKKKTFSEVSITTN